MVWSDAQRLVLAIFVSLPAFCAGKMLSLGEPGLALHWAVACLAVILPASALAARVRD